MFLWLKTLYRKRAVTWPFIFYTIIWTLSLNEYDKVVINKVKSLCEEARESISHINGSNFKQTLFNLIKLDAKISSYLFFLIHDEFMDYQKLDQLIERESWEDYYVGLTFSEKLNNYKLIDYKYLSESN